MKRYFQIVFFALTLACFGTTFTGCNEGPLEEAAESVEEAASEATEDLDD